MLYYYPNRPNLVAPDPKNPMAPAPDYINSLEASGKYVAGYKWNGDNVLIFTDDLGSPAPLWNRRKARHRYVLPTGVRNELEAFPKGCLINAELMHYKTKAVKDTLIVHNILGYEGKPLIGKTWGHARDILETFEYGDHVRLEELQKDKFWEMFQHAYQSGGDELEGIVLKDRNGVMLHTTTPVDHISWMLKIRKPCKKYPF